MEKRRIGIDLGGTGIKFLDTSAPYGAGEAFTITTPAEREAILAAVAEQLNRLKQSGAAIAGVGIALAGQVDAEEGTVLFSPNLPFKEEYPFASKLAEATSLPIFLENDANAAAAGERTYGGAQGMDDVIVLTLGTGIGSGIYSGGRMIRGHRGLGAEAGHIVVQPGGPLCGCGNRGCLEAVASGTAITKAIEQTAGVKADAKDVCAMAARGDANAKEVLARAGEALGTGLVTLMNIFAPQAIFFTGSLANAPEDYFAPAIQKAKEESFGVLGKTVAIKKSAIGDRAGLLGAAALVE